MLAHYGWMSRGSLDPAEVGLEGMTALPMGSRGEVEMQRRSERIF